MTRKWVGFVAMALLVAAIGGAHAMTLSSDANIVELLGQSNDIVVGKVAAVTDGIDDRGIPYTEVTLDVSEAIRGGISGSYTFRQFGLLAPRLSVDGRKKMMPAPPGFPRYSTGEEIALMLRPSAAWTGFRMPAGVSRGKFNLSPGRAENDANNAGLFHNVRLDKNHATEKDKRMMLDEGPANPDTFLSFLRRAVRERWVETGTLSYADGRVGSRVPPRSEPNDGGGQRSNSTPKSANAPQQLDPSHNVAIPGSSR
jgi:hypothetical protein